METFQSFNFLIIINRHLSLLYDQIKEVTNQKYNHHPNSVKGFDGHARFKHIKHVIRFLKRLKIIS